MIEEEENEFKSVRHLSKDEALKIRSELFRKKAEPLQFPQNPSLFSSAMK